jgi:hypothetical protein
LDCECKYGPDMKNMQKYAWHIGLYMVQYKYTLRNVYIIN